MPLAFGFFLFLHSYDPHLEYEPPEPFTSRFSNNSYAIVPTACAVLGAEPPTELRGVDLSSNVRGEQPPESDRHLYCESLTPTSYDANPLLGVVTDRWKYIRTTRSELYDLHRDPGETRNRFAEEPHRARILEDHLQQILEHAVREEASDLEVAPSGQ